MAATDGNKLMGSASLSAVALAVGVFLTGCASGPDYQAPAVSGGAFHNASLLEQRGAVAPMPQLDEWWKGFNDPVLSRVVQRAIEQNLDLAASVARVEQARAAAQEAGAQRRPQVGVESQAARAKQSLNSPLGKIASSFPGYERTQTLYDVGVGANWELDLAGSLKRGAEAADAERDAAEADHLGVRISIVAEAADAYFRIRSAQSRLRIAEDQVQTTGKLLDLVRLRLRDGMSNQRESALAEAQLSQARSGIPPLRIELERQLNRLDVLMGAIPGTYAQELNDNAASVATVPAITVADGSAALLRRRPDVLAAERRLAASNARIGVAMAEYYPKLSLSSLLGFESLGAGGLFTSNSFQPQAALGLRWRLFDFGRIDAEVARSKGANQEALARYRQSVLRATEDVENAIVTLVQLEKQSTELTDEVAARQRARTAAQDAYQGGALSLTEVLEEDRLLLHARDQLAQVRADDARAAVTTFRSLGGGW
ncbi:efflux transporter outer membrane subunit [Herbaspirillum rhizosphaerae]|uniref:efflux transporter outer membrane subunit n=1 Tax=Herbaspirillum rhizosphaerae TaxID=346179 RepID=UPI000B006681|nr:efflux transporter outer membrane subunit [Herbaspirillum rhizosphaerae]